LSEEEIGVVWIGSCGLLEKLLIVKCSGGAGEDDEQV
jgi:hypothetical protein